VTPYYDDGQIFIYHGDCRDVLPSIAGGVLITDPPYGLQAVSDGDGYGRRQNHAREDLHIANDHDGAMRDAALALWSGPAAVFHTPRLPEPPGPWDFRLVWDKCRPGMNSGAWRYSHELIFVRGEWARVSDAAFSVIRIPAVQAPVHPHEKPVALMRALVIAATVGPIVDPFMGSGATLRAAKDLGRRAIGIELDERYCEIAAQRLRQEALDLFPAVAAVDPGLPLTGTDRPRAGDLLSSP
jgi:DNA modification methylase